MDTLKALTKATGLSKRKVQSIWEGVQENHKLLRSCPKHEFLDMEPLQRVAKCSKCGGELSAPQARYYMQGVADALRDK